MMLVLSSRNFLLLNVAWRGCNESLSQASQLSCRILMRNIVACQSVSSCCYLQLGFIDGCNEFAFPVFFSHNSLSSLFVIGKESFFSFTGKSVAFGIYS